MDLHAGAVDVLDLQRQHLAQAQPHAVGDKDEGLVAQLASAVDEGFDPGACQQVRQGRLAGRLDDGDPVPVTLQDMLVEELQAAAIHFDGGPGVSLHEVVEVGFDLAEGEGIGGLVPVLGDTANGTGIDIDGAGGLALAAQRAKMLAVKGVELFLLSSVHVKFLR